jgi:tetratricopeptide (TPR) repeat protein
MTLNNRGYALMTQGEFALARSLLDESLELRRELGEKRGVAITLSTVAELALAEGHLEQAVVALEEALELCRELGNVTIEAFLLSELGLAALYGGEHESAGQFFRQSLERCKELGDRTTTSECLAGLACVAAQERDALRAARIWGATDALQGALGGEPNACMRPVYEGLLPRFRAEVDEAVLAAGLAEGKRWTLEQAVEYALSDD